MELAELLEREGLDPDELMTWARGRAGGLIAACEADDPLRALLADRGEADAVPVPVPVPVARRREPSRPQPLSADELPPPPEQPRLADGEPEPILETFNTSAIELGTPATDSLIAEHSSREPDDGGELEELEFDELEELDDEELELLDELDDPAEPPPPPPSSDDEHEDEDEDEHEPSPREADTAVTMAPVQTGDTAITMAPVQTGDTAAHPVIEPDAPSEADDNDDFDLDFDED